MKVLIDILHPSHVNFFKNLAVMLEEQGVDVVVSALNRGDVPAIIKKEFDNRPIFVVGRHLGTVRSILIEANLLRFISMMRLVLRERPDVGLSVGSFVSGLCLKLFGRKNYQIDDDPERFWNVLFERLTATRLYFPPHVNTSYRNVVNFNCLKEWAYLSPAYFKPNQEVLKQYGVRQDEYFLVREVSTGTLNYMRQEEGVVGSVSSGFPRDWPVLLSLEEKSAATQYPDHWQLLQEPVEDIHSLMYYSRAVVSSGDSMAREGAMLGVPSVYCGSRQMKANQLLIQRGLLSHLDTTETVELVNRLAREKPDRQENERIRQALLHDWDDINEIILSAVLSAGS